MMRIQYGLYLITIALSGASIAAPVTGKESAQNYADSLFAKAPKHGQFYAKRLTWMDEDQRMGRFGELCKKRYANNLDTETQMNACLNNTRKLPNYWLAEYTEEGKVIPKEHCSFGFDNKKNHIGGQDGCHYNK